MKGRLGKRAMTSSPLDENARLLASLVEYQDGSVVSRTLINKATGTVTLFAFDIGQSLSEHTTPFDALVLSVDGSLDITIAGVHHRLSQGEILRLPAHQPHAVHAETRGKMLLVMVRE
jgi:quercetin dioxygenase-like cupin family protein